MVAAQLLERLKMVVSQPPSQQVVGEAFIRHAESMKKAYVKVSLRSMRY
jgi:hypothetical protein